MHTWEFRLKILLKYCLLGLEDFQGPESITRTEGISKTKFLRLSYY